MALFRKRLPKPLFGNFSESYFHDQSVKILWTNEKLLVSGFFVSGPDPFGEEDFFEGFATFLGANPHTYVAITPWRLIEGYLSNGDFTSYKREDIGEQILEKGGKEYYSYTDPVLEQSGSPVSRRTYLVSAEFSSEVRQRGHESAPASKELTVFEEYKKEWGQGPLAEMARNKSGQDYLLMARCRICGNKQMLETLSFEMAKSFPKACQSCLRVTD
jgi:hypothetical protein